MSKAKDIWFKALKAKNYFHNLFLIKENQRRIEEYEKKGLIKVSGEGTFDALKDIEIKITKDNTLEIKEMEEETK